ncbi:MAG: adenine nucleotide alpha hydrolase family protein [Bacteroidales bacterium]|nr:adenine nucleotide alpha hydrolase family protein [Bacteroidales bacterium]
MKHPIAIEKKITAKVNSTIFKYQLVSHNDKVLVGLSGGKDSLALIKLLEWFRRHSNIDFELSAVFVDVQNIPYQADIVYLKQFCEEHRVRFIHHIVNDNTDYRESDKNPCFHCSWSRRKHLFALAEKLEYNKLALAHHLDDAVETLMMNMMFQANISALPPVLKMFNGDLFLIRPLIETKESIIEDYAEVMGFKKMLKTCPFEKISSRQFARNILNQMENKYDRAKYNIFKSMSNINPEYLPTLSD